MPKIIICSECGEEKQHLAKGMCATCCQRKWRAENPERLQESVHKYQEKNRKRLQEYSRRYYTKNRERVIKAVCKWQRENPERLRERQLKHLYGITLAEYNEMLEAQGGVCAICGKTPEANGRRLSVDHDHEINKNRGLLCRRCNLGLGNFEDDLELLVIAISYLSMWKEEDFVKKDEKKK